MATDFEEGLGTVDRVGWVEDAVGCGSRKIVTETEKLDQDHIIEQAQGLPLPVGAAEDDIAVQPSDAVDVCGDCSDRHVEEALLLPHQIRGAELD